MVAVWGIVVAVGLEEAAIAAIGLLIVAAAFPLGVLAANAARQLPWPFSGIAEGLIGATEAAIRVSVQWTEWSANGLATVIQAPFQAIWTVSRSAVVATEHLYWASNRLRTVTIPALYQWAWSEITSAYRSSIAHADQLAQLQAVYAQQLAATAMHRADAEYAAAIAHAEALARAEAEYARSLASTALARADLEFAEGVRHADQVGQAVAGYAAGLAAQGIRYTQQVGAASEAVAERIGAESLDYTQTVAGQLLQDIARAQAQAEAYAAAAAGTVAVAVEAIEQSPCMRFCSPLGELGGLLQGLEEAGLLALLLGLVEETRRDPGAVQRVLRQEVVPLGQDALAGLGLGR